MADRFDASRALRAAAPLRIRPLGKGCIQSDAKRTGFACERTKAAGGV